VPPVCMLSLMPNALLQFKKNWKSKYGFNSDNYISHWCMIPFALSHM
jgi:hypothetical protein